MKATCAPTADSLNSDYRFPLGACVMVSNTRVHIARECHYCLVINAAVDGEKKMKETMLSRDDELNYPSGYSWICQPFGTCTTGYLGFYCPEGSCLGMIQSTDSNSKPRYRYTTYMDNDLDVSDSCDTIEQAKVMVESHILRNTI